MTPAGRTPPSRMSLERRVSLALVAIVLLFAALQGTLAFLSLREQEDELADQLVQAEARRLAALLDRSAADHDLNAPPPHFSVWLVPDRGEATPGPPPAHLRTLADGSHRPGGTGSELHVMVLPTRAGRLFVQYDAELVEAKVYRFGYYLVGLGLLCVALAAVVARRLAAVVVAPIDRVTTLLAGWAPGAPAVDAGAFDEEQRLLGAFRRMQARFERALADEREFVANVRHEIRTPLAALRTDLELLALSARDDGWAERLERAMKTIDAISGALEATRALSHRARPPAQRVELARCVDDAWASLGAETGAGALTYVNEVPRSAVVEADRHALLTILRNLMRNAAEHAAPARCSVRLDDGGIVVEDDGPGIAPGDLPFVFERYYRGRLADAPDAALRGERGLGLAIARQVADLHGWTLSVEPAEPRGTRFRLHLRAV
jgi:signal transduction histidine kinase